MTWEFPEVHERINFGTRARERIFLKEKGVCHICELKIQVGERWEIEHRDPLWAGGSPLEADCLVAHVKCHKKKTAAEAPQRAKERRIRQKHIGAKQRSSFKTNRDAKYKKKITGEVVFRDA